LGIRKEESAGVPRTRRDSSLVLEAIAALVLVGIFLLPATFGSPEG
jgi:hypothetical protein